MTLSILVITKVEPFAVPFLTEMAQVAKVCNAEFVIAVDGTPQCGCDTPLLFDVPRQVVLTVRSKGYLESVHDEALAACSGDYVLRLDDDERCSVAMIKWLVEQSYTAAPLWKFPRAHRYATDKAAGDHIFIVNPPLWPDHQTRLGLKSMMGGRTHIHAGSPHGGGELAPVVLVHDKFVVKPLADRREIVRRYDRIAQGAGTAFAAFSVPEDVFATLNLVSTVEGL